MKRILVLAALALVGAWAHAQIGSLPYTQGFEGGLDQWTVIDADGDGHNWQINSETNYNYVRTGTKSVHSFSFDQSPYVALTPYPQRHQYLHLARRCRLDGELQRMDRL